jgi:hypothetical protein
MLVLFFICTFAYLQICKFISGSSSFGRAVAFQASGGQFEPGLPLIFSVGRKQLAICSRILLNAFANCYFAHCQLTSRRSSGVEHFLGREGVMSSILIDGSKEVNSY